MPPKDVLDFPPLSFDSGQILTERKERVSREKNDIKPVNLDSTTKTLSGEDNTFLIGSFDELSDNTSVDIGEFIENIENKIVTIVTEDRTPDDIWFSLAPPTIEILQWVNGDMNIDRWDQKKTITKRKLPPALPTIDWNIIDNGNVSTTEHLWVPVDIVVPMGNDYATIKNHQTINITDRSLNTIYAALEIGKSKPYLKKIEELHARINTKTKEDEISGLSALLFYMTDVVGIFFNYEKKWIENKEKYILRAKNANNSFFKIVSQILQSHVSNREQRIEKIAHELFVRKIRIFKERFLDELIFEISPNDIAFLMKQLSNEGNKERKIPKFKESHTEEFEFLFNFYFQRLRRLNWHGNGKKSPKSSEIIAPTEKELLAMIQGAEDYFDEIFIGVLEEKEEDDVCDELTARAEEIFEKLDKKRGDRLNDV